MALANIAQVVIKGKVHGQDYRNVLHFGTDLDIQDGTYAAILTALAEAVMACITTVLLPGLSNSITISSVTAKRIHPILTDEVTSTSVGSAGAASGETVPSFASMLIDIRTGAGGRKWRGRMFLPPCLEAETTQSVLNATALALLAAFCACMATKFIGASATTSWRLGVLSRKELTTNGGNESLAFREAKSLTPVSALAVIRRRKVGKGS